MDGKRERGRKKKLISGPINYLRGKTSIREKRLNGSLLMAEVVQGDKILQLAA